MLCPGLRCLQEFGQVGGQHRIDVMSELGHRLEKPRALFGEVRVRGHGRQLILPQIEILACECSIIWFFIHRPEL